MNRDTRGGLDRQPPAHPAGAGAVADVRGRRADGTEDEPTSPARELWPGAQVDERPGKPLCAVTDPFALEVHRAIDLGPLPGGTAPPDLPVYVGRPHDAALHKAVTGAVAGHSRLVMLVGESSTGKTRACWEVLSAVPAGWSLWHPIDPTRPEAALAELGRLAPRTVVWLNEAQHYLLTPATDLGERVAAGLRTLLGDPRRAPVLILGTIWPEYWTRLTTSPAARTGDDPHAQARALLTGHELRVPSAFSGPQLRAAVRLAEHDPRLRYAVEHAEQGQIAQYLSGAPALLERYRTIPAAARALIEAAMDARRLGHGLALPRALLATGAEGYLTDDQWDLLADDWLETAFADATSPLRGTRGPLVALRPRHGRVLPAGPCLRLADYLDQYGRTSRRGAAVPEALWNALVDHAAPGDRLKLAREARDRGLLRIAARLYGAAVADGDTTALLALAGLLDEAGRLDEALECCRRAAARGGAEATWAAGEMLYDNGRTGEALGWYLRAAEAGDERAARASAELLHEAGRIDEAIPWYQRTARAGDRHALRAVADLLHGQGRTQEAITWLKPWTEAGDAEAWCLTARLLARVDRAAEAAEAYRRAAALGDPRAAREAAHVSSGSRRADEAGRRPPWTEEGTEGELLPLRERADAGDADAMRLMGETLRLADRTDEALAWFRRAADTGGADALGRLAEMLEETGRTDEALVCYRQAADGGDTDAVWAAARMLNAAGRVAEAVEWYRRAARAGGDDDDANAAWIAAVRLREAGRLREAADWYRRAAEAGLDGAAETAAELLAELGDVDAALDVLGACADADDPDALWAAADIQRQAGRTGAAEETYLRAAAAGSRDALWSHAALLCEEGRADEAHERLSADWYGRTWISRAETAETVAGMLELAERTDEAIAWYRRAADSGSRSALDRAVELLAESGWTDESVSWLRRRAEAGDAAVARTVAGALTEAGRVDEAFAWYRIATEYGDPCAAREAADMLARAGRLEDALDWLRDRAQGGEDVNCLWTGAGLLLDRGRVEEAVAWYQQAADCGYPLALPRAVQLLETAGRTDESARLHRYGWEPDGSIAGPWRV
ncbi:tetratricopeptide repeat protein [Streptomyces sp. NPDC020192]|uniref:tetratricopeptide repeat protein n=1 Tax=Streptomyces sp. NPDC020192 TaxID=3365066 RepID=UPI003791E8C6